jgi:hypothetical protein
MLRDMDRSMDAPRPSEQQALSEAQTFVRGNIVPAKIGRVCVDGRYPTDGPETGFLARAGGDFGYVMGLLALKNSGIVKVTAEQAVDIVYAFATKDGGKFYMHTDHHSTNDGTATGCGHIARALKPELAARYGLDTQDVQKALDYIRNKDLHPDVEEVELMEDHREKGTIVVLGNDKTINHKDNHDMYFVYDKDRDDNLQQKFVNEASFPGLQFEALNEALNKQTNTTLEELAPGKPVMIADLRGGDSKISFSHFIPKAA